MVTFKNDGSSSKQLEALERPSKIKTSRFNASQILDGMEPEKQFEYNNTVVKLPIENSEDGIGPIAPEKRFRKASIT